MKVREEYIRYSGDKNVDLRKRYEGERPNKFHELRYFRRLLRYEFAAAHSFGKAAPKHAARAVPRNG